MVKTINPDFSTGISVVRLTSYAQVKCNCSFHFVYPLLIISSSPVTLYKGTKRNICPLILYIKPDCPAVSWVTTPTSFHQMPSWRISKPIASRMPAPSLFDPLTLPFPPSPLLPTQLSTFLLCSSDNYGFSISYILFKKCVFIQRLIPSGVQTSRFFFIAMLVSTTGFGRLINPSNFSSIAV